MCVSSRIVSALLDAVGVAIFDPEKKESLDSVMARADAAMYEVKNAGKGGFHMSQSEDGQ